MHQDPEVGQVGGQQGSTANFSPNLFESKQIRHNFIKKVYSLLSVQLIITVAVVALFVVHPDVNAWAKNNAWFSSVAMLVALAISIAITCMGELRRKHPHNLIILFAFTIAEALMLAAITTIFETEIVVIAAGITLVVCLAITLFAVQTKYDFTAKIGIMLVILLVATFIMFISLFFPHTYDPFVVVMSSIMAILMGIFLIIDTQMIVGGTHKVQISPEEYVFAAINVYMDIINMFLYILMILGRR